jgi:hypothetical protein
VPAYVVPIVLWIENSSGADVQAAPPEVIPEGVAQWYSLGSPHELNAPSTYLQRLSGSLGDVCGGTIADPSMADCRDAQRAVELRVPGQVAVASLATTPSLEAPLGWELSRLSTRLLCDKLTRQLDSARMDAATTGSSGRFPTLASVLRLVAPGSAVQADDVGSCAG